MKIVHLLFLTMLTLATVAMAQPFAPNTRLGPTTTANQDSCDIAVVPAATLLLPYFEVDLDEADRTLAEDTLVSVANVSDAPAVAHVTIWTNYGYPVLNFSLYLTGYDTISFSLYDVLRNGNLPSTSASSAISPVGARSLRSNIWLTFGNCGRQQGGDSVLSPLLLSSLRRALMGGTFPIGGCNAGTISEPAESGNASGYLTVDVVADCVRDFPNNTSYHTELIRYDNQLIGDSIRVNPSGASGGVAGAESLVHIRAIPPGGNAGTGPSNPQSTLPATFYYAYSGGTDRRQPLPSVFAVRYIASRQFNTELAIWRESLVGPFAVGKNRCPDYVRQNSNMAFTDAVRFDERENALSVFGICTTGICLGPDGLSVASLVDVHDAQLPPAPSRDPGGWLYLDLSMPSMGQRLGPPNPYGRPTQAWVSVRMTSESRFAVDFHAAYLANGCTGFIGETAKGATGNKIGPKYHGDVELP